jgi:hypothetical protein
MNVDRGMTRVLIGIATAAIIYVAVAAYNEIRLIRLVNGPSPAKEESVTYEGHVFKNQRDMEVFFSQELRNNFSPWAILLEEWEALLILAVSAGFLGGVVRYLRRSLDKRKAAGAAECLLGLAIGPCLLAITWLGHLLLLEGELKFSPERVAAACFIGGIFAEECWNYVSGLVKQTFPARE